MGSKVAKNRLLHGIQYTYTKPHLLLFSTILNYFRLSYLRFSMKGDQTPIADSSLQRSYEGGKVEVQKKAHVQAPAAENK